MSRPAPARIAVDVADGRARIGRLDASQFLRPRLLGVRGRRAEVALIGACAMLLAGDDLRIDIDVGPGAHLVLVEPSGTVAYNARGGDAHWSAQVRLADGARLTWAAAPFVLAQGAHVHRHTDLDLALGARALLREVLVFGRSGEVGGALRAALRASYDGTPLLVEDLDLHGGDHGLRTAPGVLGEARVLATLAVLGLTPDEVTDRHTTTLAGPGALVRAIASEAHLAEDALAATWQRWRTAVEL
ncbi:urease accessory protein UreD [Occultella gossypii]|uniref:Urease accessory protein UreD n=1 Tax=Occultella gossypii TaxID=2800820 RepID=A0ABS7SF26_9MICO|nr:urease accessory protein UreD [Occultella gossypii]MBZ2197858.1 urease accessory protein UreD [Occultella gossypii]